MELYEEFFKIIKELNRRRVVYAIIGGIAMSFYGRPRFTKDIDLLALPGQMERIKSILAALGYDEAAPPWKFHNSKISLHRFAKIQGAEVLPVDILAGEEKTHATILANAVKVKSAFGFVKVASKDDMKHLKSLRNSDQDRIDIRSLDEPDHA